MKCAHNQDGYCKKLSDNEVKQPCIEGPCPQNDVCGDCENFMGLGDWGLCCKVKYDLCYGDTAACERFIPRKDR